MRRSSILLVLAACRPTPSTSSVVPTATALATPTIPISSLAEIVAALVPIEPGASSITVEQGDAIAVCRDAGYPEELPADVAARIADQPPGSTPTIVHAEGNTMVEIVGVGCEPPGDIENAKADLNLRQAAPEGPVDPRQPELVGMVFHGAPHLAVLGAKVASTAKLVVPPGVDMRTPVAAPWRAALRTHLESRIGKTLADWCGAVDPEERPDARAAIAAVPAAIDDAVASMLSADGGALAFVVVSDPKVTFHCSGTPEDVAVLIDPQGEILYELESNNGIALRWRTDLDGDGTDEAVLDVQQLEDGGHEILLLHRDAAAWKDTQLWSAPSP